MPPIFSLCYTSRRPKMISDVIKLWKTRAVNPDQVETILCVDADDAESISVGQKIEGITFVVQPDKPFNCVKGWNMAAAESKGKIIICIADDFMPPQQWDKALLGVTTEGSTIVDGLPSWIHGDHIVHINDGYIDHIATLAIMTRARYERFGYVFYPEYESMFCTPAGTQIYMGDYLFKPVEQVKPGDEIIGAVHRFGSRGNKKLKRTFLTPTVVTKVFSRESRLVRVTLKSGAVLRCTPDHLWGYYSDPREVASWNRQDNRGRKYFERVERVGSIGYCHPENGRKLIKVLDIPELPDPEFVRDLGWLAGLYDGEGSDIFISQSETKNADVCAEIERILVRLGFKYSLAKSVNTAYEAKSGKVHRNRVYTILGGNQEYLRFLNWLRPVRRNRSRVAARLLTSRFGSPDEIVKVEDGGIEPVFSLKTDTGNYVADGYLSHNCDTDLTERAKIDGATILAKHLLFEHFHPQNHKRVYDAVDSKHDSKERWAKGETLFEFRKQAGFPKPGEDVKIKFAAYIMANKDDLCLYPVCKRLFDQGVKDFFFCVNNEYWSGRVTTEAEVAEVQVNGADKMAALGANCRLKRFSTLPYRGKNLKRLEIETHVRNDHLRWMRENGFYHILIVDSDELWKPTLVRAVEQAIFQYTPNAIKCWRIPVVGLPGVLVDNPKDNPEIYIGNRAEFVMCRAVDGKIVALSGYGVYHFTATRATMELIVDKHRMSGHYDDPDYDFEGWIEKKLPGLSLKTRDVHMYVREQIWPSLRPWTKQELTIIPEELHKYLDLKTMVDRPAPQGPDGAVFELKKQESVSSAPSVMPKTKTKATPFPQGRFVSASLYRRI